jgi:hypothetical protein
MIDLHDYSITGLLVDQKQRTALLRLKDSAGAQEYELCFTDIVSLNVDGFGLQNVILDFKLFNSPEDSFEFVRACALLDMDPKGQEALQKLGCVAFIESSVGADIACRMSPNGSQATCTLRPLEGRA